jgi:hypothetical protein
MSFGDCEADDAIRTAWRRFCRKLEQAGEEVFKPTIPANPLQRADSFRFLTQNLSQAFDLALETKNTKYPVIHSFCSPFRKLGGDNADYTYQQAWIDGESAYRISGNRGTSRFFNIAVQGARSTGNPANPRYRPLHEPFGDTPEVNLFGHDMEIGWDGSFEVYIGGDKRGPNWLPTTPQSRKLFIRNGFDDWSETPAAIRIERIGMDQPRPMPTPGEMIAAFEWAGDFLLTMMQDNPDWAFEFAEDLCPDELNYFPAARRDFSDTVNNVETDRKRGRSVYCMCWKLEPDEAMIIEWEKNDLFWMMTNMGMSLNSMDYLYRPISYSPARTSHDGDGRVRMVMAHRDPGFHNWIDTCGFERGMLANRNQGTDFITLFDTRVVKHADLDRLMPADSARVTPEQRARMMRTRFRSILRRTLL